MVLLSLLLPFVSGCAAVVIGIGAGVGTLAYVNGRLIKTYPSEYHATVRAADDTLKHLKIPVTAKVSDELETTIKAARPDGTPVNIDIVRLGEKSTQVGVRTGKVGLWDKRVSAQIQDFIGKRVRSAPAAAQTPPSVATRTTRKKQPAPEAAGTENQGPTKSDKIELNRSPDAESPDFTLYFQPNSNELSLWQMEELDRIADYIHEIPDAVVKLNGYTDAPGDPDYNRMISEVRASAIKFYLIGKGILSENIEVNGYGARDFVATNSTAEGRNRNRRVEIFVYSGDED
jgi:outer membrane protein OmpA-like peptidoglycan-associated protein